MYPLKKLLQQHNLFYKSLYKLLVKNIFVGVCVDFGDFGVDFGDFGVDF